MTMTKERIILSESYDPIQDSKVGIFWILNDGKIIFFGETIEQSLARLHTYRLVDYYKLHVNVWHDIKNRLPEEYHSLEYNEVPRGRVCYSLPIKKFDFISSNEICNDKNLVREILHGCCHVPVENDNWFRCDPHFDYEI